jgi:Ca2+-binding RTX toxin-like protein
MAASANGGRLKFTRNVGNIAMDTDGVETLAVNALGGADSLTLGSLAGTDVAAANVELGVSGAGDASVDTVTVDGTTAADVVSAAAVSGAVQVTGLAAAVNVTGSEAANDTLTVNGLGGNDTLSGGVGLAALIRLTVDGGDQNDTINGGNGADVLLGGAGNDTVDGNGGNDTAFQGDGNDTFVWDPGDGSDIVEGQSGVDTLLFNGAPGAEIFAASANGGRLLFTRNVGNIVMDTDDVEILTLNALGGIDTLTVNDLGPTDVTAANLNLGVNGAGDAAADAVTVNGTVGVDLFALSGSGGSVTVDGSEVNVAITNSEPANDTLTLNLSSGDDLVSATGLASTSTRLTINGGAGNDILRGSQGADTLNGDDNDDQLFGEAGDDTFTGGTGTDEATGGAGNDINGGGLETFTQ